MFVRRRPLLLFERGCLTDNGRAGGGDEDQDEDEEVVGATGGGRVGGVGSGGGGGGSSFSPPAQPLFEVLSGDSFSNYRSIVCHDGKLDRTGRRLTMRHAEYVVSRREI